MSERDYSISQNKNGQNGLLTLQKKNGQKRLLSLSKKKEW